MAVVMEKKVRIAIDTSEELREALRLEATLRGEDMNTTGEEILKEALSEALAMIRDRRKKASKKKDAKDD